ncbi:diguanylate cyclase (GGDEF)-like protein/PAS domain S-box-containing protein [Rahnella inusitata]|nr:diguanylate cyclase (GGDEF)-like protein/PAS domain S-box-containing protein [Rahnella inusitata]
MEKIKQTTFFSEKVNWKVPLLTGIAICLLALACLGIIQKTSSLAGLWLPTALLIPVLFHHRYLDWIPLLCAAALGIVAAHFIAGTPVLLYLPYTVNNLIEATLCALLLRRALPAQDPLSGLSHWVKFLVIAVIFCPLVSSVFMMLFILHIHTAAELQDRFATWYMSEAVAILALTPLGLIYQRGYLKQILTSRRLVELLATLVITLALGFMALKWLPYTFAFITIPLLWSAIRLPRLEAFIIFLSMTLMIALLQTSGIITVQPHAIQIPQGLIFLPLLLILLPANAMAMAMHTLRTEKSHITQSENRFRNAMEYSAIGMALVSPQGKWLQVNKSLCKLLGYEADYLKTLSFQDITHPEDLGKDLALLQQLLDDEIQSYTMEKRYLCRNGEMVWVLLAVSLVRDEDQKPLYFISQIEDITELKHTEVTNKRLSEALHEEKELLHITLNSINEAVISTDRDLNVTFMNPVAENMTGWKESQAQGQPVGRIVHITKGPEGPLLGNLQQFDINENLHSSVEQSLVLHGHNTGMFDVQLAVSPLRTLKDEPIGIVLVLQDVSKSRELMRKLSYSASHDLLTGLANRGSFEKSLKKALSLTAIHQQPHSLAFIDLDRFKAINDTAGHAAGDELLRQLSTLMQDHIRNSDRLARLGGDEFALILFDCPLEQGLLTLQQLVNKINAFQFIWEEQIYRIGASAGLTQINDARISGSEYMAQADVACYTAKHNGRGRVFTYESRQKLQLSSHTALFRPEDITRILTENQLTLHCRAASPPKTPLSVCFYQISVQLAIPNQIVQTAALFLQAAHFYDMMADVDRWLLRRVLLDYGQGIANKGICVAIPLSTEGLLQPALRDELLHLLETTPLPLSSITLMIDDAVLLKHPDLRTFIAGVRQQGCKIVVQNIGKNMLEFNQLKANMVDYVQIDPSFMAQIHYNQMHEVLVTILHGNTHRLNAQTLAGPADINETLDKLTGIGIDLVGGDTIAPETSLEKLLNTGYFGIH